MPGAVLDAAHTAANTKSPSSRNSDVGDIRDKIIPVELSTTGKTGQGNGTKRDRAVAEVEQLQSSWSRRGSLRKSP